MGQRDARVDAYIGQAAEFARPILEHLRALAHDTCPDCEESLKWGAPSFLYRGKILCSMAAFKQHASFGLWRGREVVGQAGSDKAMGQFGRLTTVKDLPGKRELAGYLRQAMARIEEGAPRGPAAARVPKAAPPVPQDLATALAANARARATFDGFPPSARHEYIEWIVEAKRDDTRRRRLAQAVEWLGQGKRRHWKYEGC